MTANELKKIETQVEALIKLVKAAKEKEKPTQEERIEELERLAKDIYETVLPSVRKNHLDLLIQHNDDHLSLLRRIIELECRRPPKPRGFWDYICCLNYP
jgi:hypothetical protein